MPDQKGLASAVFSKYKPAHLFFFFFTAGVSDHPLKDPWENNWVFSQLTL